MTHRKSVFSKYLFSYLLMLLIPIIIIISLYFYFIKSEINNGKVLAKELFDKASFNIENRFVEINNYVFFLQENAKINDLLKHPDQNVYDYFELLYELKNIAIINNYIDEILVYFKEEDLIISSNGMMNHLEIYYDSNYKTESMTFEQWKETLIEYHYYQYSTEKIYRNGKSTDYLICKHTLPQEEYKNTGQATIMICINLDMINSLITPFLMDHCFFYIYDAYGNRLFNFPISETAEIDQNKDMPLGISYQSNKFIISEKGKKIDLMFYSGLHDIIITPRLLEIQYLTATIMILVIITGLFISYILSRESIKPIDKLFRLLGKNSTNIRKNENEIEAIENSLNELIKNYSDLRKKTLLNYSETVSQDKYFYFPTDIESQLVKSLANGDVDRTKKIIRNIFHENFNVRNIEQDMALNLYRELCATLLKCVEQLPKHDHQVMEYIKNEVAAIDISRTESEIGNDIEQIFIKFSHVICSGIKKKNSEQNAEIIRYLNENYHNQNMNLSMLADAFNYSEQYMSKYFKENMGQSFAKYLESIRMNNALLILENKHCSINEISILTGYQSAHSFRRAFKRFYGHLPREKVQDKG